MSRWLLEGAVYLNSRWLREHLNSGTKRNLSCKYCEHLQPQEECETVNKPIKGANLCPKYGQFWKPNELFKHLLRPSSYIFLIYFSEELVGRQTNHHSIISDFHQFKMESYQTRSFKGGMPLTRHEGHSVSNCFFILIYSLCIGTILSPVSSIY